MGLGLKAVENLQVWFKLKILFRNNYEGSGKQNPPTEYAGGFKY